MKKFNFWAFALTATMMAACADQDDIVVQVNEGTEVPIVFNSSQKAFTRADFKGAEAAGKLGNQFVVFGYKGGQTTWKTDYTGDNANKNNVTVFDNYLVKYTENTAHTTESNSANWEYVLPNQNDVIPIKHATAHGITQQSIKYWDYTKTQYDFFAWSTGSKTAIFEGTPTDDEQVLVSEMKAEAATESSVPVKTGLTNAYTFTGTAKALSECYISDLVTVLKTGTEGTNTTVGYNKDVVLTFRQLGTKIRFGIYETVPGYSVKEVKFYTAAATNLPTGDAAYKGTLFTTTENAIRTSGKYTVYFPTVDKPTDADNNQAHIEFDGTSATGQTTLENGTLNYTIAESGEKGDKYLGRSSNTASFAGDPDKNYYEIFLPNEDGANLNLRVNYTLESIDGTGETIEVKGATAQVPLIYTQWKPGYAYTYLFKISDKTNGYTGVYDPTDPNGNTTADNPAGLYPITFDAMVVNAEDGKTQETITTVSAPSITTYQKGSTVVNDNEYKATTGDIYVTVNDAPSASPDLPNGVLQTLTDKVALYKINPGKTEAEVIDALSYYYTKTADASSPTKADPQPTSGNFNENTYYTQSGTSPNYTYTKATSYVDNTDYYTMTPYTVAAPQPTSENFNENTYYTQSGTSPNYTYTKATNYASNTTYYTKTPITSGTIKGRNGMELTGATYSLVKQVKFGADGNVIAVSDDQALRFTPSTGTYAFVYTKSAGTVTGDDAVKFQPVTKAKGADVEGLYRYKLKAADAGDVQEGVIYFDDVDASNDMITPFLGQTVNNLYLDNQGNTIASGYAKTGTPYYYTVDGGQHYIEAHNVAYADKNVLPSGLYEYNAGTYALTNDKTLGYKAIHKDVGDPLTDCYTYNETNHSYTPCTDATASSAGTYYEKVTGKAYYYKQAENDYRLCVFLPQQTTDLYVFDGTNKTDNALGSGAKAVKGMVYFDRYTYDDAVRYAKVIKVE